MILNYIFTALFLAGISCALVLLWGMIKERRKSIPLKFEFHFPDNTIAEISLSIPMVKKEEREEKINSVKTLLANAISIVHDRCTEALAENGLWTNGYRPKMSELSITIRPK